MKFPKLSLLVAFIFVVFPLEALAGPISPSRGILIYPHWRAIPDSASRADTCDILGATSAWGSVYHGFKSASDEFGWSIDLGALIEIARWGEHASLIAVTDMELTAKTDNDIYFSPRGGIWEEGLLYSWRGADLNGQFGYLHRCRHDIDNGDSVGSIGRPVERTLIYGSVTGKLISNPFTLFHTSNPALWKTVAWLSGDLYVFREDYRQSNFALTTQPDFRNILFSVGANLSIDAIAIGTGKLYARGGANFTAFGADRNYFHSLTHIKTTTLDGRIELGYAWEGRAARMQLFVGWENFNDDGTNPVPENSHFTLLGIRLTGNELTF